MKHHFLCMSMFCIVSMPFTSAAQVPLGTDFTYQGQLKATGLPTVANADFRFSLFDAVTGGSQIGSTLAKDNAGVVNGLFTLPLDFGAAALNGNARWLEVAVRSPAGSGGFTTLAPRQPLTGTPYAIQTRGLFVDSSNRVGINTTSPLTALHVNKEATFPGGTLALEGNAHATMTFFPHGAAAGRQGYVGYPSGFGGFDLVIANEIVGGNIDLVTTGGGTTKVNILEITGADVAEKFPVSEKLAPGMVVAIDKSNPGKLCLARGAYNRCVAGVVSGANNFSVGAVLGSVPDCKDAPPIALTGRVYVQCDTTTGAIEPGDLLTTSNTAGHAMKVIDYPRAQGAIIGKAMTGLKQSETGPVLVLVNLQ